MIRRSSLAAATALALLVGCGAPPAPASIGTGTVVVGNARTGAPVPSWNDELDRRFRADLERRASWAFVGVDERPTVMQPLDLVVSGDNELIVASATAELRAEAERRLGAMRADDPEVDVLGALHLAGRLLAGQPAPRTILLLDSLLQTAGALRFQDRDGALLSADPAAVAEQLARSADLPQLAGIEVVLIGAGDTVSPQAALPPPARLALIALWRAVLQGAGATVRIVEAPVISTAADGLPTVTPVPVATPQPVDGPVSLPDSAVGFVADQAVLRDRDLATVAVAPFAARLLTGGVRAVLTGTTSSAGTPEGRLALSRDRAATVAGLLRTAGVPAELIETRGVGTEFPGFVPDRDPNGRLDPVRAAANRQVIIELIPLS